MKYAHIDDNNQLLGWYDDTVHSSRVKEAVTIDMSGYSNLDDFSIIAVIKETEQYKSYSSIENLKINTDTYIVTYVGVNTVLNIPEPNIPVSDTQWQLAIDNQHNKVNPDGTTELVDFRTIEEILTDVKEFKLKELKQSVNYEASVQVGSYSYIGGYDSAQKLNAKRTLVIEADGTEVNFLTADEEIVSLSLTEARDVCVAVAMDYENKFYAYKIKKKAIQNASSIEELNTL